MDHLKAYSLLTTKSVTEGANVVTVEGIASTPTPDREYDVIEPMGARFKLPIPFFLYHDSKKSVGNVVFAKKTSDGIPFKVELPIVTEEGIVRDRVNEAIHSLRYRLLNAVSIGFLGIEGFIELLKTGGLRYREWDWFELSLVGVPMNPDAVITGVKSIDAALRARDQEIKSADQALLRASLGTAGRHVVRLDPRAGGTPGNLPGASGDQRRKGVVYLK